MKKTLNNVIAKSLGMYINILSFVLPKKSLKVAYYFFSQPRKGRFSKKELPKILSTSELLSFNHNEHSFQSYIWKGNKDVILLIHGWESNAARWKKFLKQLRKTRKTIIAIDAPAHGLSSGKEFNVPQYAAFIDTLSKKFNPQIIIGHSIGGTASIYYQHHYENKSLQKMILLGAPSDFKVLLKNYVALLGLNERVAKFLANYTKQRFGIPIDEFSGANFLKSTTLQGIIAHDVDDTVVSIEEAKKLVASWKTAEFIQTKGLGHSMHDEYLYKTIIDFIEK